MSESDPREDESDETGAEGGSKDSPPPTPDKDDDSPLGDTDQHSDADA